MLSRKNLNASKSLSVQKTMTVLMMSVYTYLAGESLVDTRDNLVDTGDYVPTGVRVLVKEAADIDAEDIIHADADYEKLRCG